MTSDTGLSAPDAAKAAGASYRQIDYWCSNGVFGPEHIAPGTGNHRQPFSPVDVAALAACTRVSRAVGGAVGNPRGASVRLLAQVVAAVRAGDPSLTVDLGDGVTLQIVL